MSSAQNRSLDLLTCLAILILVLGVAFGPALLSGKTLMTSSRAVASITPKGAYCADSNAGTVAEKAFDCKVETYPRSPDLGGSAWQQEAWIGLTHRMIFEKHEFPLWNPSNGCGGPLLANMQSQLLSPLIWLPIYFKLPVINDIFLLLRLLTGGVLFFLWARLLIGRTASIVGAVSFMLTGYMVLFINMPEISSAMMLPGVFYAYERLYRRFSAGNVLLVAVSEALTLFGGMPEVAFLALVSGGLYFIWRTFAPNGQITPLSGKRIAFRFSRITALVLANVIGFCLSAPAVFPFLELAKNSFNIHDPSLGGPVVGRAYDPQFFAHAFDLMLPLDLGGMRYHNDALLSVYGYSGFLVTFLALLAAVHSLFDRKSLRNSAPLAASPLAFTSLLALILYMKFFGLPPAQWIAQLPIFNILIYQKYGEPIFSFAIAFMAATGFELVASRKVNQRILLGLGAALTAALLITQQVRIADLKVLQAGNIKNLVAAIHFNTALLVGATIFTCVFTWLSRISNWLGKSARYLIAFAVPLELCCNFILPAYYLLNTLPPRTCSAYDGAPYISFLQDHTKPSDRITGRGEWLYPDWSGVFAINDLRAQDAIYIRRWLPFVRNFLTGDPLKFPDLSEELATFFVGTEYTFPTPSNVREGDLFHRLLALSSIKYLVGDAGEPAPSREMEEILRQNSMHASDKLRIKTFGSKQKFAVLFHHPTQNKKSENQIQYQTVVPKDKPILTFSIGLEESIVGKQGADGAKFEVSLIKNGKPETIFSQLLEATAKDSQRYWQPQVLDLTPYAGKEVILAFATSAGENGNAFCDWSGWRNITWTSKDEQPIAARVSLNLEQAGLGAPVYKKEVTIWPVKNALPRVVMFNRIRQVFSEAEELKMLRAAEFNLHNEVVVDLKEMSDEKSKALTKIDEKSKPGTAEITDYGANSVKIKTNGKSTAMLMLTDSAFPGWKVYINGHESPIYRLDYLFRGVIVGAGEKQVEFRYEPFSLELGLAAFVAGALLTCFSFMSQKRRRSRSRAQKFKEQPLEAAPLS